MASFNRVMLMGNLTRNPELRYTPSGNAVVDLGLAVNESYKNNKGERMTDTQWHHVIAWGKTAELIELYLGKGKEVALEGKLVTRFWDDQEGQRRYTTEVHCHTLLML